MFCFYSDHADAYWFFFCELHVYCYVLNIKWSRRAGAILYKCKETSFKISIQNERTWTFVNVKSSGKKKIEINLVENGHTATNGKSSIKFKIITFNTKLFVWSFTPYLFWFVCFSFENFWKVCFVYENDERETLKHRTVQLVVMNFENVKLFLVTFLCLV